MAERRDHAALALASRRRVLGGATALGAGVLLGASRGISPRAVALDAFPILNPGSVFAAVRTLVPEHGEALQAVWFQKIFADTSLRTAADQYLPFTDVLAESLDYAAQAVGVSLSSGVRDQLLVGFWSLDVWPDVHAGLARLSAKGCRLVVCSNLTEPMLRANLRRNGLEAAFEAVISTDRVGAFKPAPQAYALAKDVLGLEKSDVVFAPFAAWDAAGAAWYGYPTAWVNRAGQPAEPGAPQVPKGRDLAIVMSAVGA